MAKGKSNKSDTVHIKSRSKLGFRRAGIQFTSEYQKVDLDKLEDEQREALEIELQLKNSNLVCEELEKEKAEEAKKAKAGDK